MRIIPALLAALAALAPAGARGQTCIGPGGAFSGTCGTPDSLGRLVGAFGTVGAAAWPEHKGIALTVGAFHAAPVGFEATIFAPVVLHNGTTRPVVVTTAALRLAAFRGGIGADWNERARPPALGYVLGARLGGGFLWGLERPGTVLAGLTAELVVGGWLLVGLRPTLALARRPEASAGDARLPFDAYPMLDLTLGSLAPGVYAEPASEPVPVVTPPPAPVQAPPVPAAPPAD